MWNSVVLECGGELFDVRAVLKDFKWKYLPACACSWWFTAWKLWIFYIMPLHSLSRNFYVTSGHRWITVPSFFFPFLRLCLLARAAPSHPSTATSRNWRSPSLPSPLCPLAPRSMWLENGRPIRTRMVGTSTTIAPPRRGPGSHLEPGTIAPETCKERATAPERAQR